MEHTESGIKGAKTVVTTSIAGFIAFAALPWFGYEQDPLDPIVYAAATAFVAGAIKYIRNLANQALKELDINIVL